MSKRVRENYLRAVLRQDIAYFDNVGAGEVATRIQTDTRKGTFLLPNSPAHKYFRRPRSARHFRKGCS